MEKNLKTLQLFYAAALADSVYHYNNAGILGTLTEEKYKRQCITAPSQLKQLNINHPAELFTTFSKLFGCIHWEVEQNDTELRARGTSCLLCALAKKINAPAPCHMYCINPFKAMLKSIEPGYKLDVEKTLWNDTECLFCVS